MQTLLPFREKKNWDRKFKPDSRARCTASTAAIQTTVRFRARSSCTHQRCLGVTVLEGNQTTELEHESILRSYRIARSL